MSRDARLDDIIERVRVLETTPPAMSNSGSRPVPDPTELTDRAIARLRSELIEYITGQLAIRDERLGGIDEATKLRLNAVTEIPNQIDEKVGRLKDLVIEKFDSVQRQFLERDTRSERESRDNKVAVDAAFAAQKEAAAKQDEANAKAIDKSEKATAETIKTNQELNQAKTDSLTKAIDEVKLDVRGITVQRSAASETVTNERAVRSDQRQSSAAVYAAIGLGITILLALLTVIGFVIARLP